MKKYRYRKSYRTKKKKSILWIFKSKIFWLTLLFLAILGTGFHFLVFSSFFQIKEIKVSGNEKVSLGQVQTIISNQVNKRIVFFNTRSIFLVDLKEINKMLLERFPLIAKVGLARELPNTLSAHIEERKPVAVFAFSRPSFEEQNLGRQAEDYFFIDKEGVIFEKVAERPLGMLIIKSEKEVVQKEQLGQILEIHSKLRDDLGIPIEEVLIISKRRLNARTIEGWEIYFNPERNLNWQLTKLGTLLKERVPFEKRGALEYIDLRFEKIYIFPETYQQ